MGDGSLVEMTGSELRADIEEASEQAARKAKVPPLTGEEIGHLLEIYASSSRFTGVDIGKEVVLTVDGSGTHTFATRLQDLQIYEQMFCTDVVELCHPDYSYKAVRTIVPYEAQTMHDVQFALTAPVQYGAMPNLGLYSKPDGPCENWSELLPLGRIEEARAAQEEAVELAASDMIHIADALVEGGADGIDFDTAGAAGDGDFLATLRAVQAIRAKHSDLGIQVGMAGEFVLGVHGALTYQGKRLAGLWPRDQMRLATEAGATIFGPAINANTGKSAAWNMARAITLVKPCVEEAEIPIHMNVGMGVGGVPMAYYPPLDAVSRASRASVELLHVDGL